MMILSMRDECTRSYTAATSHFCCSKKGLLKQHNRVPCYMMILRLSRITTSVILIILTIKHIYIYIKYCLNALSMFYFNICQLICIPYDISNVRHYTNAIQKYQIMRIIEVGRNHKSLPLSSYCCYQHVILMLMSRDCPNSFTRTSIM